MTELDNINSDLTIVIKNLATAFSHFVDYRKASNKNKDDLLSLDYLRRLCTYISDEARTLDRRILAIIEKIKEKEELLLPCPCLYCDKEVTVANDFDTKSFILCDNCDAEGCHYETRWEAITTHNTFYNKLNPENSK